MSRRRVPTRFGAMRGPLLLRVLALSGCAVMLGLVTAATNAAAAPVFANWTQWAFNAQHTGYNPQAGLDRLTVASLTQVFATSRVFPDPIVVNGKVYAANRNTYKVQAVDASTGAKLWSRGACIGGTPTDPAFAGGSVWVALDDPGLAAVSASGTSVKCVNVSAFDYLTPPSAARGIVYDGSEGGVVSAVNAVTGQVLWDTEVAPKQRPALESPTVSHDGSSLFVVGDNGFLYKLKASTGQVLWSRFIDTCAGTPASVTNSLVYVGGCNLYALSPATGQVVWRTSRFGPNVATPTIAGGMVIADTVGTSGNSTGAAAFNATTGHRVWFDPGFRATAPLTASDGVVFLNGGYFIAILNSSTGATITDLFSPGASNYAGSVVPAEGRLYVCTVEPSTGVPTLLAYQPKS
jgi:outer membrane protein assembly factor BamB